MSEIPETQIVPIELQQPPVFTDAEANAVLKTQADLAWNRHNPSGYAMAKEYVMGVTYDGTVVSVDEKPNGTEDHFTVRVGKASQLAEGVPLSEQRMAYGIDTERLRDGGTTLLYSQFGNIRVAAPQKGVLPQFEGKVVFPIGQDGKPFMPAAEGDAEAEATLSIAIAPQPEQTAVRGIGRFLHRN